MRCERAVHLLATGGPLGRRLARRHAAQCPRCASEAAWLERIARELSAVEPLSAAQRALWTSMSGEPRPTSARPHRYRPVPLGGAAMAAVLAVAVVIGVTIATRRPPPMPVPVPPVARSPEVPQPASPAAIRELDDLKARFQALSRDVALLRRKAELLDERKDAATLSGRFPRTVALYAP